MNDDRYEFEVEEFAVIGRTFTEYTHMFDLDPAALDGPVLDCPSGVGSSSPKHTNGGFLLSEAT